VIDGDVETTDINAVDPQILAHIEADSYWCLSKFIDCIQVQTKQFIFSAY